MNDKEWIENIQNISNEELFKQLDFIGCDGYYSDLWVAIIEELKRRTKQQDNTGDLISREALMKEVENAFSQFGLKKNLSNDTIQLYDKCTELVLFAPKVEERPKGEWIYDGVYRDENNPIDNDVYHCNLCKRSIMTSITRPTDLFPFCHCGADMRK